jgi:hypothetical protein
LPNVSHGGCTTIVQIMRVGRVQTGVFDVQVEP